MTYVLPLGTLEEFTGLDPADDQVYVLRVMATGVTFGENKLSDPLEWVAALGRVFGSGKAWGLGVMAYDIRGILFRYTTAGLQMDFIVTYSGAWPESYVFKKEWDIRNELDEDTRLNKLWTRMKVIYAAWKVLTGKGAGEEINYWLAQPLLWDHRLGDSGGLTQAYQDMLNVWVGDAESRQKNWRPPVLPPIEPPKPEEPPDKPGLKGLKKEHVIGFVAVAAIGYFVLKGSKGARA